MDDEELDFYYKQVFGGDEITEDGNLLQQLRNSDPVSDEYGFVVEGCYRVRPAKTE